MGNCTTKKLSKIAIKNNQKIISKVESADVQIPGHNKNPQNGGKQKDEKNILAGQKALINPQNIHISISNTFQVHTNKFVNDYTIFGKVLGRGKKEFSALGRVAKAQHNRTQVLRAVKILPNINDQVRQDQLISEVGILKQLDHPNIIKIYDFYYDQKFYYIVMEYCEGGELFETIQKNKYITEQLAAGIMSQILNAVCYLHENNLVHRDIKPENLLFIQKNNESTLKLIDFGLSEKQKSNSRNNQFETSINGTINYMSPEAIQGRASFKSDIWSCGVLLFFIICGHLPFHGCSDEQTINCILKGTVIFDSDWDRVSGKCISLVQKMLSFNPGSIFNLLSQLDRRPTARKCLQSAWLEKRLSNKKQTIIINNAISNMKEFTAKLKIQQAILLFAVNLLATEEQKEELTQAFQRIDLNHDGKISRNELLVGKHITNQISLEYKRTFATDHQAQTEVDHIFQQIDVNGNGEIDFSGFQTKKQFLRIYNGCHRQKEIPEQIKFKKCIQDN